MLELTDSDAEAGVVAEPRTLAPRDRQCMVVAPRRDTPFVRVVFTVCAACAVCAVCAQRRLGECFVVFC